ncbi:MAG TPA: class I SAM-dependent methyltransferase [Phycisphaerales bacterium]|nr:class I SAM-dependent methyltransferase [Phycisphaerales bacterium]
MAKASVSEFFHSYAEGFDAIYGNKNTIVNRVVNKYLRSSMRLRFEKSIAACNPIEGRSVLDVGTGPGHYAITLARRGAGRVLGLDFAEGMLNVARQHAQEAGVADKCEFRMGDFIKAELNETFDYVILMGFMDYMSDPAMVIDRALSLAKVRVMFSFPRAEGLLAWQRQLRYKSRCDLFQYSRGRLEELFSKYGKRVHIEPISRDYFVTVEAGAANASSNGAARR